jgi:hypothetical protein
MLRSAASVTEGTRRTTTLVLLAIAAGLLPLLVFAFRDAPLLVDLGPGDEPYARGFRSGWEYHGRFGETAFHWTEDGAKVWVPVDLEGPLRVRLRVARFTRTPAQVVVWREGHEVGSFTQHPLGWRVRTLDVPDWRGPLALQFRTTSEDGDALGIALDWVMVTGAARAWPRPALLWRVGLLLFGVPIAVGLLSRSAPAGAGASFLLSALGVAAVLLDRLGGLLALAIAALPALAVVVALLGVSRAVSQRWPDRCGPHAAFIPAGMAVLALVALSHPAFYYPDVDTHAKLVDALEHEPSLALDPRPYQVRTGAWTRGIGGRLVPFPYSPAFHVLARPLAKAIGSVSAIKTLAVGALGLTLLMTHLLARAVGLAPPWALVAQAVVCVLPVTASRLTLALYPTLLAQSLELFLLLALGSMLPLLRARETAAALGILAVVQAAYTGSLLSVPLIVTGLALSEALRGRRPSAARLLAAWALATLVVVLVQYRHFVGILWRDVLPYASRGGEGTAEPGLVAAIRRLTIFFDHVHPGLALLGVLFLRGGGNARRVWRVAFGAGLGLLALRYALPALFRDAKEVELLAAPVAVAMAAGWSWLWTRGWGRAVAVLSGAWVLAWGCWRAAALYVERFTALGR